MRITALAPDRFPSYTLPDIVRATTDAIDVLRDLGATVTMEEVPLDFDEIAEANGRIIAAEAWALHRAYIEDEALDIDPWVRRRIIGGKAITADQYRDVLAERQLAMSAFADWMRGRDALLTPTLPITATPLAEVDEATAPLAHFTRVANYLGACALSLPAGFSAARSAGRRATAGRRRSPMPRSCASAARSSPPRIGTSQRPDLRDIDASSPRRASSR